MRTLGLIETINVKIQETNKNLIQPFDFLWVLDFESTCWNITDSHKRSPEIIEFAVVLYHIKSNTILEQFQQYVTPMENSKLSEFCRNLTGISQEQVDNGVPLSTCLMLCTKWIKDHTKTFDLTFPSTSLINNVHSGKKSVFVTWSDWDLNICLQNECRRKRIAKDDIFNKWIDLRALYREYYHRRPKGLNGALTEVGLNFIGQEHCGLDDAINTALLAGRMVYDGVLLRITKDISFNP